MNITKMIKPFALLGLISLSTIACNGDKSKVKEQVEEAQSKTEQVLKDSQKAVIPILL